MKKNTEIILAFLVVILLFVLFGSFLLSRLDLYRAPENQRTDDRIPNTESLSQEVLEDRNRAEYIARNLHRGFFESYNEIEGTISIQAENRIGAQKSAEIKQFEIKQNQTVLCWPLNVPGTETSWQNAYMALEQNGYLFLNGQQETMIPDISTKLSNENYIFIHELGGIIQEIAIAGCAN